MVCHNEFSKSTENLPSLPNKEKINSPRHNQRKREVKLHDENPETNEENIPKLDNNRELDVLLLQLTELNNNSSNYFPPPDFDTVSKAPKTELGPCNRWER